MTKKEIGKIIQQTFKESGMNTVELFKATGITSEQFKNIVHGKSNYTINTLTALSDKLKLKVEVKDLNNPK